MSIFSSLSRAICTPLDAVSNTAESLNKSIDICNVYVAKNHIRLTGTISNDAQLAEAQHNQLIANTLEADAKLKAQYEALSAKYA